ILLFIQIEFSITKNFGTSMEVMTLQPHAVSYFLLKARMSFCQSLNCCEVYWRLMVFFYISCFILLVIEVLITILATHGFLLYRLSESNSFPQFFTETYEPNKIHLSFSSLYVLKYTRTAFIYPLVWLLTNRDLRHVYESIAFTW